MSDLKEVKRVSGQDGKRMVVLEDSGGLFHFQEETRFTEKSIYTEDSYTHWVPTHVSGLYDSAQSAEQDARMELPWLRDADSK